MIKNAPIHHGIIIAGSGIAGHAIALGLARLGFNAVIIAPKVAPPLGGIQLAPNGWGALDALGMTENKALIDASTPFAVMRLLSLNTGHSLHQIDLNDRPTRTPYASVTRKGLMQALRDAAKQTDKIKWIEARITQVHSDKTRTYIALDDGTNFTADWLIGGDGVDGACRHYVAAEDSSHLPHDRIARKIAFKMVIAAAESPPLLMAHATNIWLGDGGHIVHYPLADGTVNITAVVAKSPSARKRTEAMLGQHPCLSGLRSLMDTATVQPLYDHPMLDTYQRGRVVVAGDAAHPMSPHLAQGGGQSLIDGASLMQMIARHADGKPVVPPSIMTMWTAERARMMATLTASTKKAGSIFGATGAMARLRNLGLSNGGGAILERQLDRLWQNINK